MSQVTRRGVLLGSVAVTVSTSGLVPSASEAEAFNLGAGASAMGPLTVKGNYFRLPSGKAVLMLGDHTWVNNISGTKHGQFDWTSYLSYLAKEGANIVRFWAYDCTQSSSRRSPQGTVLLEVFARSSTSGAADGGNKFDLTRLNPAFVTHLQAWASAAQNAGIYIQHMLFFSADPNGDYDIWNTNYWNGNNNVNGTTTDQYTSQSGSDVTTVAMQKRFVEMIADAYRGYPNILFEIANEPYNDQATTTWEDSLVQYGRSYEQSQGYLVHPWGIGANYPHNDSQNTNSRILATSADWFSPQGWETYQSNPPNAAGQKVALVDSDHTFGIGGNNDWVWQVVTRGYGGVHIMDDMTNANLPGCMVDQVSGSTLDGELQERYALRQVRAAANLLDFTSMLPRGELASSGFCVADPASGNYLVYAPSGGVLTVDLSGSTGRTLNVHWLDTNDQTGAVTSSGTTSGGASRTFNSPTSSAVLVVSPLTSTPASTPAPTAAPTRGQEWRRPRAHPR